LMFTFFVSKNQRQIKSNQSLSGYVTIIILLLLLTSFLILASPGCPLICNLPSWLHVTDTSSIVKPGRRQNTSKPSPVSSMRVMPVRGGRPNALSMVKSTPDRVRTYMICPQNEKRKEKWRASVKLPNSVHPNALWNVSHTAPTESPTPSMSSRLSCSSSSLISYGLPIVGEVLFFLLLGCLAAAFSSCDLAVSSSSIVYFSRLRSHQATSPSSYRISW